MIPTFEPLHPLQVQAWKKMSFEDKAQLVEKLYHTAKAFFIEHHHIFSASSLCLMVAKAGFKVHTMEPRREPSTKQTLY